MYCHDTVSFVKFLRGVLFYFQCFSTLRLLAWFLLVRSAPMSFTCVCLSLCFQLSRLGCYSCWVEFYLMTYGPFSWINWHNSIIFQFLWLDWGLFVDFRGLCENQKCRHSCELYFGGVSREFTRVHWTDSNCMLYMRSYKSGQTAQLSWDKQALVMRLLDLKRSQMRLYPGECCHLFVRVGRFYILFTDSTSLWKPTVSNVA